MRCQNVIDRNNANFSNQEVFNGLKEMLNRRLRIEKQAISIKYGRTSLNGTQVRKTWERLLENESELPDDWTEAFGGLVGIEFEPLSQRSTQGQGDDR